MVRLISLLALTLASAAASAAAWGSKPAGEPRLQPLLISPLTPLPATAPSLVEPLDAPAPAPEVVALADAEDLDDEDDWPVPVAVHTPAPSAPKVPPPPFEGIEYHIGALRIRPSEYKPEAAFLVFIALYAVAAYFGEKGNSARAEAWFDAHEVRGASQLRQRRANDSGAQAFFRTQFAAYGFGKDDTVMANGKDEYLGFASGRRGCEKLDIKLTTDASHDLLVTAYRLVRQVVDFGYDSGENKVVRSFSWGKAKAGGS